MRNRHTVLTAFFTQLFTWTLGALFGLGLHNMGVDTFLCGVSGALVVAVYGSLVRIRALFEEIKVAGEEIARALDEPK